MIPKLRNGSRPLLLLPVFFLLAAWSLVVPIFEAPDEPAHWQFARFLHDRWTLPRYAPGFEEANSPPLYYLAIAPIAREAGSPSIVIAANARGEPVSLAPPRTFLNTDDDFNRYWPIRVGRLVSVLMSVATVWLTFLAGRAATARAETGLLAALFVALLPQFSFRAGHVSNDALVTCLSAATTAGIVRLTVSGFTWRRGLLTATALAAAYLSKISAIALAPPLILALIAAAPHVAWPARIARLAVLGVTLLLVLPWSVRNQWLYGDPFASGAMHSAVAHIITERSLFSRYFLTHFPTVLFFSFVGVFGWANILLPFSAYVAYAAGGLVAAAALLRAWWQRQVPRLLVPVLLLVGLSTLAVVVRINLQFTQPQGRYLFPALPALAVLAAIGVQALPRSLSPIVRPLTLGAMLTLVNLGALAGVVWPAYYPPPLRTLADGTRRVQPVLLSGLALARDGAFIVNGAEPWWLAPVDVSADAFGRVVVDVSGQSTPSEQRLCVFFATNTRHLGDNQPRCADWRADGRVQRVSVVMTDDPHWKGVVTHIRLDPFRAPFVGQPRARTEVRLGRD